MTKKNRPTAHQRRKAALAARSAARREEHIRLVREREGDPNYAHRMNHPDGSATLTLDPYSAGVLSDSMAGIREEFRAKFGREMRDDDPLFWDDDADTPQPMSEEKAISIMVEQMEEAGIDPAYIYAFRVHGYIVTEQNQHTFTAHEVDEWLNTAEEYDLLYA